jgi:hypothetical protein
MTVASVLPRVTNVEPEQQQQNPINGNAETPQRIEVRIDEGMLLLFKDLFYFVYF